jgi:FAD dependent oxidoreductase TIGR03364
MNAHSPGRLIVVGAGIAGLANAWSAAERGWAVTVLERSAAACGASVRNFGMIWPIGQPTLERRRLALASRDRWLRLGRDAGVWVHACGSLHLAYRDDEWAVLREFAEWANRNEIHVRLLLPDQVLDRTTAANPAGLIGGLFSPDELAVNPRTAAAAIAAWLARQYNVRFEFDTTVVSAETGTVRTSNGDEWHADRILVCSGADTETLFPDVFAKSDLQPCKLHMLQTVRQPGGWRLGPHLAGGLTLRHYANFEVCPSLPALKQRIARESPELDQYGVHVMASQTDSGGVILGDSHEYGADISPFNKEVIDELILRELRRMLVLPDWTIAERWQGVYLKNPGGGPVFVAEPLPGVHIFNGVGGTGMTLSLALAEHLWSEGSVLK